jgi:hypothetical protein
MCASIQAIKYVYKYVYKGHDCANVQITATSKPSDRSQGQWDEIKQYIDSIYVSAPEACWLIFALPLTSRSHTVYRLAVHLPEEYFIEKSRNISSFITKRDLGQQESLNLK